MSIEQAHILASPAAGPAADPAIEAAATVAAFAVAAGAVKPEGGTDPAFGTVTWRTLICADRTPSAGLVLGIAEFGPSGVLPLHRHAPAEFYLGLSGSGCVTVDGQLSSIGPGIALYIPADAEHGVIAGAGGLSFAYGFAADRFSGIEYRFSAP